MPSENRKKFLFASFTFSIIACACPSILMFSTGITILWGDTLEGAEIPMDFPDWSGIVFLLLSLLASFVPVLLGVLVFLPELKTLAKLGPLRVQSPQEGSNNYTDKNIE